MARPIRSARSQPGMAPPLGPLRPEARADRLDAPPLGVRRGSRSSSEGPAAITSVYSPRRAVQETGRSAARMLWSGPDFRRFRRCRRRQSDPLASPDGRTAPPAGRAIAPRRRAHRRIRRRRHPPALPVHHRRRRAVGDHRPQRRRKIDLRPHRAGAGAADRGRDRAPPRAAAGLRAAAVGSGHHLPDLRDRLRPDGAAGQWKRHPHPPERPPRRRAARAGRGRRGGVRAPAAPRSVGRAAAAGADGARAGDRRRPDLSRRADQRARRRLRAGDLDAHRPAAQPAGRRGRDGHPLGGGRARARRSRAAARPRPRRGAGGAVGGDAGRARVPAHLRAVRRPPWAQRMNPASWQELWANIAIFKDAIWAAGLAGALLGFIGVHVVLRRMVFASSAIAQAAALGVALSFWVPALIDPIGHAAGPAAHVLPSPLFEPVLWAIAASLLATLVFIANPVRLHLTRESLLGFVFLVSGAGAVIIGDKITQEAHDLAAILFGSAVVVQTIDLYLVTGATVLLLGGHLLLWRALIFVGYDPMGARVQGMPVRALNGFLFVSVGLAVALCTRALGALPVFAFSVLPAMTALAVTARIGLCFVLATVFGAFSGVAGYAVSFRAELPVGATQTATGAVLLTGALLWRLVIAQRDRRRARSQPLSTLPPPERASTAVAPRTDAA